MKMEQLNGFVYDIESGVIGAVAGVDFIKQTITILADDDTLITSKLTDVEFLVQLGEIGGVGIIDGDVVITADDKMYEIVAIGESDVQLHLLDRKLKRVEAGSVIERTGLSELAPYVTLVGNIRELEPIPAVEFNVTIVRQMDNGEFKGYYYACNNADKEEVDLIKVVFIGHNLLKEEKYERITVTHDEYLELVEDGTLKEVNPQELMNYVTGLTYGKNEVAVADPDEDDDDFEDEDEDLDEYDEEDYDEDFEEYDDEEDEW
jgi:hypothetical protein